MNISKQSKFFGTVAVCISEDWFAASHFKPLLTMLVSISERTLLITQVKEHAQVLAETGVQVIPFNYARGAVGIPREPHVAVQLAELLRRENIDVLHCVSMRIISIGAFASWLAGTRAFVAHITGLGQLVLAPGLKAQLLRWVAFKLLSARLRSNRSWILAENSDDLEAVHGYGVYPSARQTVLGGAGVDPNHYYELPVPENAIPIVGFVGRFVRQKGLHVLINAHQKLLGRGLRHKVYFYGSVDSAADDPYSMDELVAFGDLPHVEMKSYTQDVRQAWAICDIAVVPSISREGMPRAMLEAASCGRPLVATRIPGSAHFLRNGMDGYLAAPGDANSLADAITPLITDPQLRTQMGKSARQRVLANFTVSHVTAATAQAYYTLSKQVS